MSKLFFDHLIISLEEFEELEVVINKKATSQEEKDEFRGLVEDFVNTRVTQEMLGMLSHEEDHLELMGLVKDSPHDGSKIFRFLKDKTGQSVQEIEGKLQKALKAIGTEALEVFKPRDEVGRETEVSKR